MAGWLSGDTVARITVRYGWKNAFLVLAVAALLTALVALVLVWHGSRSARAVEVGAR
jgi:sugar phosphate permease